MKIFLLFILSYVLVYGNSEIDKNVNTIAASNFFYSEYTGYHHTTSDTYSAFKVLKNLANSDQYLALSQHENAIVRLYAVLALSHKYPEKLLAAVIDLLDNNTKVQVFSGCSVHNSIVSDVVLEIVYGRFDEYTKPLVPSDQATLDNAVLQLLPRKSKQLGLSIQNMQLNTENYSKIKNVVLTQKNQDALVNLAKYQRKEDVDLILSDRIISFEENQKYRYMAIQNFPHPNFFSLLENNLTKTIKVILPIVQNNWQERTNDSEAYQELLRAIEKYPTKGLELIKSSLLIKRKLNYNLRKIGMLVHEVFKSKDDANDIFLEMLWEKYNIVSWIFYKNLIKANPEKVDKLILHTLQNLDTSFAPIDVFLEHNIKHKLIDMEILTSKNILSKKIDLLMVFADDKKIKLSDALYWKVWRESNYVSTKKLHELIQCDLEQSMTLMIKSLDKFKGSYTEEIMFDVLIKYDRKTTDRLLNKILKRGNSRDLDYLISTIKNLQNKKYLPRLITYFLDDSDEFSEINALNAILSFSELPKSFTLDLINEKYKHSMHYEITKEELYEKIRTLNPAFAKREGLL
jgi:hypothetical protein